MGYDIFIILVSFRQILLPLARAKLAASQIPVLMLN